MKLTKDQMNDIVDGLQGTCMSYPQAVFIHTGYEIEDYKNEQEFCEFLDNALFECAECGWWFENGYWNTQHSDMTNEYCLDCRPEDE